MNHMIVADFAPIAVAFMGLLMVFKADRGGEIASAVATLMRGCSVSFSPEESGMKISVR